MKRTTYYMLLLALAAFLVACGGPVAGPEEVPEEALETDVQAQVSEGEEPTTAASNGNADGDSNGDSCDGRLVQHAMGETCVPETPQRVVVLDTGELDSALAVGVKPVGAVSAFPDGELPEYLSERTEGIEVVGTISEPNLEAILALQPDLILSSKTRHEELYDELSAIAPTVFAEAVGVVWKENLLLDAEALGKRAEAEALMADYEARLAELQEQLGDEPPTVSMVRFLPGQVRIYLKDSFIGTILEDAGLPRPEAQDVNDFALFVDKEGIPLMDGDVMFVTTYGPAEDTDYADFSSDPLWQSLEVVQEGNVYEAPDSYWMLGIGMIAANMVIDDLYTYLGDGTAAAPDAPEAGAGETRTVVHAMGETEVPADPQRVVVLDTGELDNALALNANLVGAPVAAAESYQPYLVDQLKGLADTGGVGEPNLEAILATEPDLILGSKQRHEEIYDELSAIAPTVFTESLRVPWQETFAVHAEALGKEAEAGQLLDAYEGRIAQFRDALGGDPSETTVSVVRFRPGQVRVYLNDSFSGNVLRDVGLARPEAQDVDEFATEISLEGVPMLDADVMFYTSVSPEENDFSRFTESPLWQTLDVVSEGRVYEVSDAHWMAGLGVQAANLIIDDLFSYIVDQPPGGSESGSQREGKHASLPEVYGFSDGVGR